MSAKCSTAARAAALLGAASGMRASMGLTTLCLASPAKSLPWPLSNHLARRALGAIALAELVGDKLPNTPDRTIPASVAVRMAMGAVAAGIAGREIGVRPVLPCLIGAVTAAGATYAAHAARVAAARRLPALAAALGEDALAATVGFAGARAALS